MALLHPQPSRPRPLKTARHLHPSVGLIGGLGLIIGAALVVHVLFNALL